MGTPLHWIVFNLFILVSIMLDLRVFIRHAPKVGLRDASVGSAVFPRGTARAGILRGLPDRKGSQRRQFVSFPGDLPRVRGGRPLTTPLAGMGRGGRTGDARNFDRCGGGAHRTLLLGAV